MLAVFGPEHAPLEQRTVENAWREAQSLGTDILLFCAFQFDSEAAKDIDELSPEKTGMQLLKVQMNPDLLTGDLRKAGSSDQSFWLIGQPEIRLHRLGDDQLQVEVLGFDYYDPEDGGSIQSGSDQNIAMWMLDTDYDGRSLYPSQVFFPMTQGEEWDRLKKNLRANIDPEKMQAFCGTKSLPFRFGEHRRIAVKIIDDRGIESVRVLEEE